MRNRGGKGCTVIRVTYFFTASQDYGWSESYLTAGDNLDDAVLGRATAFSRVRRGIMHRDFYLEAFRMSLEDVFGDSRLTALPPNSQRGLLEPTAGAEQPFDGLLVRCEAGPLRRGMRILRGLPRGVLTGSGAYGPTLAAWTDAWSEFVIAMIHAGINPPNWMMVSHKATGPVIPLIALNVQNDGLSVSFEPRQSPTPPAFAVDTYARISRVTSMSGVNRVWKIAAIDGTKRITYPQRQQVIGTWNGPGTVRPVTVASALIDKCIPLRGVRRDTGRPFDTPRGRRRAAR